MSRMNPQEYQVLQDNKFNLYCSVLGVKEQCCFAPDKKVIEKAFRKNALKCHPDKGGDPVVFKKLNEAYNKLIGHIIKLEQQAEAIELANSILIEVSKTSVTKWHEKLKTRYGWFKTDNCKNIIFDGPYKQYMGRSKNTGNITVVLYEDPPDQIPKLHVRSNKYMAWIAEQQMPVHMHVEKGKTIQFDQWRIAHLAEFGICNFASATPPTPTPEKKEPPKPKPKTPKAKRREAREASERRAKTRRDSEPTPEPGDKDIGSENNKENTEPKPADGLSDINGNDMQEDVKEKPPKDEKAFNCGHCGEGFNNMMDYALHKKVCVPDEDFGFSSGMQDAINNQFKTEKKVVFDEKTASTESKDPKPQTSPTFQCDKCAETFTNMVWYAKHKNSCQISKSAEAKSTSASQPVSETTGSNVQKDSNQSNNIPTQMDDSNCPRNQHSPPKHSKSSSMSNETNSKKDNSTEMTEKELKDVKVDVLKGDTLKETVEEVSPNKNDQINKIAMTKNDNELNQKITKENISTDLKEKNILNQQNNISIKEKEKNLKGSQNAQACISSEKEKDSNKGTSYNQISQNKSNDDKKSCNIDTIKNEDDMKMEIDENCTDDQPTKKNNQCTKTGKVTKLSKTTKVARALNKDKTDTDMTNKLENKIEVESMDVDEPEITDFESVKPLPKKNDMQMGSLLTNLPTTAKPTPESDMEMEKSVNKPKLQVDKNISESEVPDKKSKTVVKFDLDKNSNSEKEFSKKHSKLDKDASELSNKIFTHIDGYDEWVNEQADAAPKAKAPLKSIMKKSSFREKQVSDVGKTDAASYTSKDSVDKNKENVISKGDTKIQKIVENGDTDKKEQKDHEIEREKFTNGITETQEGLNKKLTSEKSNIKGILVNDAKKADNILTENTTIRKAKNQLKSDGLQNYDKNVACQTVNNEKQTPTLTPAKVESMNEKLNINGTKNSVNIKIDSATINKAKIPLQNGTFQGKEVTIPCQNMKNENLIFTSDQIKGEEGKYSRSNSDKSKANNEQNEQPKFVNGETPAHKTFTKNMAVIISPKSPKKEISNDAQNSINSLTKPLSSKNHNEHETESSSKNSNENSCAGKIYKERETGHDIIEGKINNSEAPTVKMPILEGTKKSENNIEVKHAKQCFVVNQPLSPSLNRKVISPNTTQTDDGKRGTQSKTVQSKSLTEKSQIAPITNWPNTVKSESKKVVVVTPNPNDTKTRGENTSFLETSKNSYTSSKSNNTSIRDNLNTDLEKLDKDHEVKMQKITTFMDNSREKTNTVFNNNNEKSLNILSESRKVVSQNPSDDKRKPKLANSSNDSTHNSLSLIPQALQQNFSSSLVQTATKTDLNKDLEKLDKQHEVKMKKIEESLDISINKKMDLSNTEVHANRPRALGPSRFDNPSQHLTETYRDNIPKRNDSIHTLNKETVPKSTIQTVISEKPSPPTYQIAKSSTTVLDTRNLSPGLSRKKMDSNFNASPEPFTSSKSSSNVLEQLTATSKTSAISSLKDIKESNIDKSQSIVSKASILGSKSYSTIPSMASLPKPSSTFSSQTPASSSFPTVASLPKPASFSSNSTLPSASTQTRPTSLTSTSLSSPSNFAQSSNFDKRAKSEGSTLSTNMPASVQNNYSLSNSSNKTTSDLYMKIQTTKDKHKSDIQSAMNFDKNNWKPPVIKHKYDRPDPTPSKYTMTLGRDKMSRIEERERVVIDKLMMDRASRGKSDDFLKNSSYRL